METIIIAYNIFCPVVAYICYVFSVRATRELTGVISLYFSISSAAVFLCALTELLESSGNVYYFAYSLFSILFVFKLCLLATKKATLRGCVPPFFCAFVLFVIYIVNVGVHYESMPILWDSYIAIVVSLELMVLGVCVYLSRVVHGFVSYVVHRRRGGNNTTDSVRCGIIDWRIKTHK